LQENSRNKDCQEIPYGGGCHPFTDAALFGRAAMGSQESMEILPPADSTAVPATWRNKPVFHRVVDPSQLVGLEGACTCVQYYENR
jgi:hypothetical protein